jgi:Zn-dependent M28 family amino/carboxypeptidase
VEVLASPEFGGRSGAGGDKAADYLIEQFRRLKLEGLFQGEYTQAIPGKEPGTRIGRNVGALLRGSDPTLRDQWLIVAAHFDHLGVRGGKLFPGADDNASGVAMMLEVARCIARAPMPPKRSVMFIGFDLEEVGLFGSRYFVAHPPVPLDRVVLFITADMIGRALAGVCDGHVFILGTEHAPGLRPWIQEASQGRRLTVGLLGSDLLVLNRSDYGPFRSRGIPFLFFTTGENPRYHTPEDTAETLDYPKLTAIAAVIHHVVHTALAAPTVPRWQANPDNPMAEAVTLRDVLRLLSKNSERLKIGAAQLFVIHNTLRRLEDIVARGAITPEERALVIQGARIVLFTVL